TGSLHPTNGNFALGGNQDNGTANWTGASSWQEELGGDGADNAISDGQPDTDWAMSFDRLAIRRTTDGGLHPFPADSGMNTTNRAFIGRFRKCPSTADVFTPGTDNLWKTTDFFSANTPSWFSNGPELGTTANGRAIQITAVAFAPSDATCKTYA